MLLHLRDDSNAAASKAEGRSVGQMRRPICKTTIANQIPLHSFGRKIFAQSDQKYQRARMQRLAPDDIRRPYHISFLVNICSHSGSLVFPYPTAHLQAASREPNEAEEKENAREKNIFVTLVELRLRDCFK